MPLVDEPCAAQPVCVFTLLGHCGLIAAHSLLSACARRARWAVGLHWLVAASRAVALAQGATYWQTFRDALDPGFMRGSGSAGRQLLEQLQTRVRRLGQAQVQGLAAELVELAEGVWHSAQAAGGHLEKLREFVELPSPQPAAGAEGGDGQGGGSSTRTAVQQQQQEEEEEGQGQPGEQQVAGPSRQRDVFYSKESRREALVRKATQAAAAKRAGAAAGAAAARSKAAASPGSRLSAWLIPVLRTLLAMPPSELAGEWGDAAWPLLRLATGCRVGRCGIAVQWGRQASNEQSACFCA